MPKSSPGHCGRSGTCWTHSKGQVRHLGLLGSYFQGPLPFSPSLSPRTNLKPQRLREIHRQVKNAQTTRSQTTGGKFSPQLESVCAQRPRWTHSGEDSPWSKLAFGTLAQKPLWREWCRGKVSVLISKWELMGGEGKHHSWVAYLDLWGFSKARFTQTIHPNHICRFQNDSRILSAQKPLWCLEAVNLKKWKCYSDKKEPTDLAETESRPRCVD